MLLITRGIIECKKYWRKRKGYSVLEPNIKMTVLNFLRTVRNNWKKSVIGTVALSFGASYAVETYDTEQLMRQYCEDVVKYGDEPCSANVKPRHVTVILNPVAKKRKAKKLFEKYCEPLLHLAGIAVRIISTESEGQVRNLIASINVPTDAIIVAGGDGTLSDVVTGLMRKFDCDADTVKQCPIGILPLGERSQLANSLFSGYDNLYHIRQMAEATVAIIKGNTCVLDVIEVEPLQQELEEPIKPVYALGVVEWGIWQDVYSRLNKYWYFGSLRKYVTYIINGCKEDISNYCNATLRYTDPCTGCSACYQEKKSQSSTSNRRWWHAFMSRKSSESNASNIDYSKITNEKCGVVHDVPVSTTEIYVKTYRLDGTSTNGQSSLQAELGPENVNYISFVKEGWKRIEGNRTLVEKTINAKSIELHPKEMDKERNFYIDNEQFELKPIKIRLISQAVTVFCPESKHLNI